MAKDAKLSAADQVEERREAAQLELKRLLEKGL